MTGSDCSGGQLLPPDSRSRRSKRSGPVALILLLGLPLIAGPIGPGAAASEKPNIIVFYTDDQDVGSMANMTIVQERLAAKGVTFTNSFVDYSLCCPSRVSFMLGQSAHNTGITGNGPDEFGGFALFAPLAGDTLPVWLERRGYEAALSGKVMNVYRADSGVPPGWAHWFGYLSRARAYKNRFNQDGVIVRKPGFGDDLVWKDARDWIVGELERKQAFFALVSFHVPHAPHVPARRYKGAFSTLPLPRPPNFNEADIGDKPPFRQPPPLTPAEIAKIERIHRARQAQLLVVEDAVKHIIRAVQKAGQMENTYFIYTSDNGFAQGEHRRAFGKRLLYEEVIRVPLIIRGPGIPEGETRDHLVNNLDVVATIADLAGATPGHDLDGRSLKPIIANPAAPWRTHLLVHGDSSDNVLDLTIGPMVHRFSAVRTDRWILARNLMAEDSFVEEFYDLERDPWQLENAINDPAYADIIDTLRPRVEALSTCAGRTCWMTLPEPGLTAPILPPEPGLSAPLAGSALDQR